MDIFDDEFFPQDVTEEKILTVMAPADVDARIDVWLTEQFPEFSRARIQAFIWQKRLTCNGYPIRSSGKPKAGQIFKIVVPPPLPPIPQPEDIPLDIVYEDPHCLVLNKPAGLIVHPAAGHPDGTLVNALLHYCHDLKGIGGVERPGIVHRLDKDTSGLIIIAKSDQAMMGFADLFHDKAVTKIYLALVHGCPEPPEGRIENLLARKPQNKRRVAVVKSGGRIAITNYRVEKKFSTTSLIRCQIETGRTHQIRVHMRSLGCPILGDYAYGRPAADKALPVVPMRQMLHATHLSFVHPVTGQPLDFNLPPPEDFMAVLAALE